MRILIIGLRKEKKRYLVEEFPEHDFVVKEFSTNSPVIRKEASGKYDLVLSMTYHIHHAAEKTVIGVIGETPFERVPGNISNLKSYLHSIEKKGEVRC